MKLTGSLCNQKYRTGFFFWTFVNHPMYPQYIHRPNDMLRNQRCEGSILDAFTNSVSVQNITTAKSVTFSGRNSLSKSGRHRQSCIPNSLPALYFNTNAEGKKQAEFFTSLILEVASVNLEDLSDQQKQMELFQPFDWQIILFEGYRAEFWLTVLEHLGSGLFDNFCMESNSAYHLLQCVILLFSVNIVDSSRLY